MLIKRLCSTASHHRKHQLHFIMYNMYMYAQQERALDQQRRKRILREQMEYKQRNSSKMQ